MNRPMRATASIAGLALLLVACGTGDASPTDAASAEPTTAAPAPASEAAVTPGASAAPGGEEATVTLDAFAFDTSELTVAVGTTVSFVNADSAKHTVTEGTDGSAADDPIIDEELDAGATATFTFDEPGAYEITCLLHPDMNMTITVEG